MFSTIEWLIEESMKREPYKGAISSNDLSFAEAKIKFKKKF